MMNTHTTTVIFIIATLLLPIVSSQACTTGWTLISGRCYRVFQDSKSWYESRQACQSYSGDLATIKSMDIQNQLTLMLVGTLDNHWIGLSDQSIEGQFFWVDGTALDPNSTRWNLDEPNDYGDGEDCVEMFGTSGLWNDESCESLASYICERSTDVIRKCDEDNGWVGAAGRCYKYYDLNRNWEGAKAYCRGLEGSLMSVVSAEEQAVVAATSALSGTSFWIGLTNKYYTPDTYKWSTQEALSYTNWAPNEPANRYFDQGGDCAEVLDTSNNGEWTAGLCTDTKAFMCERDEGVCPPGWRIHKGNCYQFNSNTQLSYTDAKHMCEAQGAFLVSIFSGDDNDYIVSYFADLVDIGVTDIWIGIADYPTDGVFTWSDSNAVVYTNWKTDEPANTVNQHDCGMIFTGDSSGQWNTDNCYVLKSYVCKTRAGQPVYTVSPNLPVGTCPAGWNLFGDSCYYIGTSRANWATAEERCVNDNAHLVAINDEDEQSYISMRVAAIGTPTWIGLKDSGSRTNFMWSDGSSLDFINWAINNPNYNEPGDACVVANSQDNKEGQWNDVDCTGVKPYICEKAKSCETYTTRSTDFDYYYRYHPSPLPTNRVEFEVQANNDVHVALSSSNTGQGQTYEVVIGGWSNTQSVIRRCVQCANEVVAQTIGILSGTEFRGFWITYDTTGLISVGKYGEGFPFMQWMDPNPFQINYVGYSTGFGSQGEFRFCNLDSGSSGTIDIGPTPAFDARCGSGWEYDSMTGNCYLFKPTDYKNWADAELECNKGGGNLVSISGLPEMSYINARMVYVTESRMWIGATDGSREGGWMWSDNSAFRYLNWNTGEPNNAGEAGEHCAEMYVSTGTWNDIDCGQTMGYICKKNGYLVDHFNVYHSMYIDGYDNLQITDVFPEECAKQCVQQTDFTCRSFEYNTATMECSMSDTSVVYSGVIMSYKENVDYYERPVGDQCPSGWEMNLGQCFYFNKFADKTWDESRAACQVDGGDLVMIKSAEVENWLTTRIVSLDGSYWIGLHDISNEGDFEWIDGSKLVDVGFSRWDLRQPDNAGNGEDCVEMWTSGLWNDQSCDGTEGYICGKDTVYDVPFEEVPPTLAPVYRCPSGWHTYGDNCYLIQLSEGSWQDARDQCKALGAELASIHDNLENQFIATLAIQTGVIGPLTHFWIGLNDLRVSLTFEWVDGSEVVYTKWSDDEPNNFIGADEDCVEMDGAGAWNDERCSMINPSVCKMGKKIIEGTVAPVTSSGCELGWTAYGGSCYGVPGKVASSWNNAQAACRTAGAKLASIKDRFEQTVVTSVLSQENGNPVWIGLNDVETPGEYEWSDGTAVTYTHWDYQQPKQNNGNCVAATSGLVAGLWQINDCGARYNYLCEKVRDGFTAPPMVTDPLNPTTPNDNDCAQDWIGYGDRCFRIFDYGFNTMNLLSWQGARSMCVAMGGDLASFHSTAEEDYIVQRGGYKDNGFWIGLHDRSTESGFEWSDGSVLDYVNWNNGEPNNANTEGEDCVEMFFNGRGWNDIACGNVQSWICQIERGKIPSNPPSAVAPSEPSYTPCPLAEDWILEGYYCYYISAGANMRLSWNDANAWCMENDGYLASIHGRDEQDKLIYYAQSYTYNSHWIGIREYDISGTYVWADGTPLDFENWNTGEPNDANGEEQCGEMYSSNGLWNDVNCENPVTFICKRPFQAIAPVTYPPTPTPTGYCQSGWVQYGSRCYKIYGASYDDRRNWYQARESCQAEGADLIKIHTQEIQSFVVTQMKDVEFELYIGLSDISVNEQFRWVDGSYVDYTNWNSREPNEAGGEEDCVELTWQEHVVGKWNDVNCEGVRGFICQKNVEESNPKPSPVDSNCDDGYVPYFESCFRVLTSETNFQTAGASCQNDGYDLASISDIYEQSFVETLMYSAGGNPLWIGMNQDQVSGEYKWADGWPTYYTNWGYREPSQGMDEGCVVISGNGTWDDTACSSNYGAVCKYTSLPRPTFPPDTPGECPSGWLTFGNDCFLVRSSSLDLSSFPEAQYICKTYGGQLASIHSSVENQLIQNTIALSSTDVWIGMDRELNGAYKWVDETSVNYLNWAENEPSYSAGDIEETCVEMYPNNGLWNDRECLQKQGFVCRAPKNKLDPSLPPIVTEPVVTTPKQNNPEPQTGVSAGGIVGIVIGVLAVVLLAVLLIIFFVTRNGEPAIAKDPGLPPSVGFDNALYKASDKDTTIQIGSTDVNSMDA